MRNDNRINDIDAETPATRRTYPLVGTTHPSRDAGGRFLQQVPQVLLVLRALALAELLLVALPQGLRLLAHLLVHVLLALVVLVLATRLQVQLVHAPVGQVLAERQHAHLVHQVQLARPVEVQHLRKRNATHRVRAKRFQGAKAGPYKRGVYEGGWGALGGAIPRDRP